MKDFVPDIFCWLVVTCPATPDAAAVEPISPVVDEYVIGAVAENCALMIPNQRQEVARGYHHFEYRVKF